MLWLYCKDLLKEACFSLEEFDNMTDLRIYRIIHAQEERLKIQQKLLEEERKKNEEKMASLNKKQNQKRYKKGKF